MIFYLHRLRILLLFLFLWCGNEPAVAQSSTFGYSPDILGAHFIQKTIVLGQTKEGETVTTVIKYVPEPKTNRVILYLHGYNDYFFQGQAAEIFANHHYRFYAIDLRAYGRSYRPHQYPFQITHLHEYFQELDTALALIKAEGGQEIFLMGHSTGGLISALYVHHHNQNQAIKGLVLNSPFLDMNLPKALEKIGVPLVSAFGKISPMGKVRTSMSPAYAHSLLKSYHGEWEFDTNWKHPLAPKLTMGWTRAIHLGHKEVKQKLNILCPILLMSSDTSIYGLPWTPQHQHGDAVLDVRDIQFYGSTLGPSVIPMRFHGGLHDLLLSEPKVRDTVYKSIFRFLDNL